MWVLVIIMAVLFLFLLGFAYYKISKRAWDNAANEKEKDNSLKSHQDLEEQREDKEKK